MEREKKGVWGGVWGGVLRGLLPGKFQEVMPMPRPLPHAPQGGMRAAAWGPRAPPHLPSHLLYPWPSCCTPGLPVVLSLVWEGGGARSGHAQARLLL